MTENKLMGYARRSKRGGAIKLSIHNESFDHANSYKSKNGEEYTELILPIHNLRQLLDGTKEVTSIVQLVNDGNIGIVNKMGLYKAVGEVDVNRIHSSKIRDIKESGVTKKKKAPVKKKRGK
jgi:predicted mannosyl-3-phosphoglycerate phosphatase (HAD superfamily)